MLQGRVVGRAMKGRFWSGLLAFGLSLPAAAQVAPVSTPTGPVMAGPYIVIDAATGETLQQQNAGAAWYPASLTKLMTIYSVFRDLKAGRLTLETSVPFSQHAASMPPSKLGVAVGGAITVEQALQSLVARSANDAAVALGELVSGSEPAFAQRMTETAVRLDMKATRFRNANGLPDPEQISSARDLAILAQALVRDFPEYYGYFRTQEFMFGHQKIGPGVKFVELYSPYADGMKTGFICASGFNLVGSAVRNGRRLIGVALGFRRADLRDEFMVRQLDAAYALKTSGGRTKIWQLRDEGGTPATIFTSAECNPYRYDYPGDAAWLGTYGDWRTARNAYDQAEADLVGLGVTWLGKEFILPVTVNGAKRQAAIIADLEPAAAQKLCADYHGRRRFCQVRKPSDFVAPFSGFWR
jgi:D-alanyl-D-alanine carboxypeptidase